MPSSSIWCALSVFLVELERVSFESGFSIDPPKVPLLLPALPLGVLGAFLALWGFEGLFDPYNTSCSATSCP
ncbi:hypothetical protein A2U01_0017245 [Trifolium medium]|uniref:Uncharacterized protein n=1 Tax=Trifolium medium TaxID=97028 RepID=A0A392N9X8_9FABA|nr:hypothetical protein [Trifolium medium]